MKRILMLMLCIMATLHFVNAGPSEKILAEGPWNGELLITLRDLSAENIAQQLEENTSLSEIGAPYVAVAQREVNGFSLVDWFFFGGECFDGYILYDSIAKRKTDEGEKRKYEEIAARYNTAYLIAKDKATNLVRSPTPIVADIDNCHLVKYFLISWLYSTYPMQINLGIWRQYKGVILVALAAYYDVAVKPEHRTPDETNVQFYKNYVRAIKAMVQPQP
ncbi:MAG: hypothetical protein LBF43_02120 [Puniceicoccales bacterium]|jgi:hypothetical protein|nr:hypothetical protein [Puniceicoccales bacterium]